MTIGFIELERRVKALEDRLAGQRKSLTFLDPKCNIPCTASLEQKIERLIAYFERHSRENQKRSEKLDKELQTTLMSCTDYKAQRAQLLLPLRESRRTEYVYVPVEPNPPERWIVEKQHSNVWSRSLDVPQEFSSEAGALQGIAEAVKKFGMSLVRRARRID